MIPHRVHVGELLGHQVAAEGQEVLLNLNLHFLILAQAERAVTVETTCGTEGRRCQAWTEWMDERMDGFIHV